MTGDAVLGIEMSASLEDSRLFLFFSPEEVAFRKKRLCIKFIPRDSTEAAICDIRIMGRTKQAPPQYTFIGYVSVTQLASFCQGRSRHFWGRSPETVCATHEVLGLLGRGEEWASSGYGHGARGAESSPARRSRDGGSWQDLAAHESGLGFMPGTLGSPWGLLSRGKTY